MMDNNLFDDAYNDIAGTFDLLDKLESYLHFAFMPQSKKAKFGRLNLVNMKMPRAVKMQEQGINAPNFEDTQKHLKRFGVDAKCSGFDSQYMYFQVRKSQETWALRLLDFDANGVPQLWQPASGWKDPKPKVQSTKSEKPKGFLEQLFGL